MRLHHMNRVMDLMARKRVCEYAVVHTASSDAQNTIACQRNGHSEFTVPMVQLNMHKTEVKLSRF